MRAIIVITCILCFLAPLVSANDSPTWSVCATGGIDLSFDFPQVSLSDNDSSLNCTTTIMITDPLQGGMINRTVYFNMDATSVSRRHENSDLLDLLNFTQLSTGGMRSKNISCESQPSSLLVIVPCFWCVLFSYWSTIDLAYGVASLPVNPPSFLYSDIFNLPQTATGSWEVEYNFFDPSGQKNLGCLSIKWINTGLKNSEEQIPLALA